MDELVRQVAQKAGIAEEQARTAVVTVIGFLKEQLPAPIAGQLDGVISGGAGAVGGIANTAGDVLSGLGGMLGGKKSTED